MHIIYAYFMWLVVFRAMLSKIVVDRAILFKIVVYYLVNVASSRL